MLIMKSRKRHKTEGMEQTIKEKIRTLGEKESYKYLGILEPVTIKLMERKEKTKNKNIREKRENYSKPNYIVGI